MDLVETMTKIQRTADKPNVRVAAVALRMRTIGDSYRISIYLHISKIERLQTINNTNLSRLLALLNFMN